MDMKKIIAICFIVSAVAFIALIIDAYRIIHSPLSTTEPIVVQFDAGSSLHALIGQLQADKLLTWRGAKYFKLYTRLTGQDARLQAGEYTLAPNQSINDLLEKMQSGEVTLYAFTIIEGWNIKQLRTALADNAAIKQTLDANVDNNDLLQLLGFTPGHPEGQFYPDTYKFPRGTSDVDFLKRAYEQMQATVTRLWGEREANLPYNNAYEALIMASIIEKESAVAEERPLISAVFVNRLRKKMRLQTDPTVIYGMGDAYDGDIRYRDLRTDTPYNTYTRAGLPPSPIAMPSEAAIYAALHPADSDYLYFVSRNDGSHVFSKTLAEHEAAVDQYQRNR